MFRRDWPEVEHRAKHLWSIKNNPVAAAAFWAWIGSGAKIETSALALKQIGTPSLNALLIETQIFSAVGAIAEAEQAMLDLEQADPALAERLAMSLQQQEKIA